MTKEERSVLRELAKRHIELAAQETNRERIHRIRCINGLVPERPIVWIDEIPWHEIDINGELQLKCEDEQARRIEEYFRRVQFRWKYFQADMVIEDAYYILKSYHSTDTGIRIQETTLSTDSKNYIVSHRYEDQLDTEDKVDALKLPVVTAMPDTDRKNLAQAEELIGDIMPVHLRGHGIYYAPWDVISMSRGVEPVLIDMVERPDFVHKIIGKFTDIYVSQYEQMEAQGLLDFNIASLHCTPPYVDELPAKDYDGGKVRLKDIWFRGMAQMFSTVSPAMHNEFELQYASRLFEQCGLIYYGCCEPLDNKIGLLKRYPNMRKIGVSPWADVARSAEQMGGSYVLSRKPNPANVAMRTDPDVVRAEVEETVRACREHGTPCDYVLKDISTVSYRPENLIIWERTVRETLDRYYK